MSDSPGQHHVRKHARQTWQLRPHRKPNSTEKRSSNAPSTSRLPQSDDFITQWEPQSSTAANALATDTSGKTTTQFNGCEPRKEPRVIHTRPPTQKSYVATPSVQIYNKNKWMCFIELIQPWSRPQKLSPPKHATT